MTHHNSQNNSQVKVHEIEWDREKVGRFWQYYTTEDSVQEQYASGQRGRELLNLIKKRVELKGLVMDFGCGPGYFLELLLEQNINCLGVDSAKESVDLVLTKFKEYSQFKGAIWLDGYPLKINDNTADMVFLIETIEHLLPENQDQELSEIYRILKPGGKLIVTTPNEENLEKNKVFCPECGSIYHRMQHMRSFSAEKLCSEMDKIGFKKIDCVATTFNINKIDFFIKKIYYLLRGKGDKIRRKSLIYIGEKK